MVLSWRIRSVLEEMRENLVKSEKTDQFRHHSLLVDAVLFDNRVVYVCVSGAQTNGRKKFSLNVQGEENRRET